jgi:tRNA threonylcarbamoyladenosine biosynthesis protein TsaB
MTVLGFDTATPSTAVAVMRSSGEGWEERHDPAPGERPEHAAHLLALTESALSAAGVDWPDVELLAVGVGPGGFTGMRIGIATARALAQARGIPLAGVSSLHALARGAQAPLVVAAIDARRGEVFSAAWAGDEEVLEPAARAPDALAASLPAVAVEHGATPLLFGDGAVRFRAQLESAGADVPEDGSALHRLSAKQTCRIALEGGEPAAASVLPDYRRAPDAQAPRPRAAS